MQSSKISKKTASERLWFQCISRFKSCTHGKQHRAKFPTSVRTTDLPLGLVHSDLCGKMNEKCLSGAEYFLCFIDDKTHYVWVSFLKRKSQSSWEIYLVEKDGGERKWGVFEPIMEKNSPAHSFKHAWMQKEYVMKSPYPRLWNRTVVWSPWTLRSKLPVKCFQVLVCLRSFGLKPYPPLFIFRTRVQLKHTVKWLFRKHKPKRNLQIIIFEYLEVSHTHIFLKVREGNFT